MSIRCLRACGLALLMACITAITVSAKGGYAFITITGPDLEETVRTSDAALTDDFFAFADFYRDRVDAPADAGAGYEVTRYYMDGGREIAFDRLHYYPAAGFVYYDGLINGSSEYDGKWYSSRPEIASVFEAALADMPISESQSVNAARDTTTEPLASASQMTMAPDPTRSYMLIAIAAGLAVIVMMLLSRRKISAQ